MFALPIALTRDFVSANDRYHDKSTPDKERSSIVENILVAFREHDPNVSIWDMLALFDAASGDELSTPPAAFFISASRAPRRRA